MADRLAVPLFKKANSLRPIGQGLESLHLMARRFSHRNILVNKDGVVGIVQLNRPKALNERNSESIHAIILEEYVGHCFSMIPFEGTEDFYEHLGFSRVSRWDMRR